MTSNELSFEEKIALLEEINSSIHQLEEKKSKIRNKPGVKSVDDFIKKVNQKLENEDQNIVNEFLLHYKKGKEILHKKDLPITTYSLFKPFYINEGHFDCTAGRILQKHKEGRYLAWALNFEIYNKMHNEIERICRKDNTKIQFPPNAISCFIYNANNQQIVFALIRGPGKKQHLELITATNENVPIPQNNDNENNNDPNKLRTTNDHIPNVLQTNPPVPTKEPRVNNLQTENNEEWNPFNFDPELANQFDSLFDDDFF